MNNKERLELQRKLAAANTPLVDRVKAWCLKWSVITLLCFLLYKWAESGLR